MSYAVNKPYYEDQAVVLADLYATMAEMGKTNPFFKFLAWLHSWVLSTDHKQYWYPISHRNVFHFLRSE